MVKDGAEAGRCFVEGGWRWCGVDWGLWSGGVGVGLLGRFTEWYQCLARAPYDEGGLTRKRLVPLV